MDETERLHAVLDRLTRSVREAVEDLQITVDELWTGLRYLTEVGRKDEFPLLSDVLGVSVLVDAITHGGHESTGTATNVEGPFYKPGAPVLEEPYALAGEDEPGEPLFVSGRVVDAVTRQPLDRTELDVWQANASGIYDNQDPSLGEFHLRGCMAAGPDGAYEFRTVVPPPYEIPKDGPVGALLRALGRHAFRPAHLHLKATADGYAPLTTMVYFAGDAYLESDTIGAVKDSLVVELRRRDGSERGLDRPFSECAFDVALRPAGT